MTQNSSRSIINLDIEISVPLFPYAIPIKESDNDMKRQNNLDSSVMLRGLHYGEHTMNPDRVVEDLDMILDGCANAFVVRCRPKEPMKPEMYRSIARYAGDKGMPFAFLYAGQYPPEGRKSHLDESTVKDIEAIAGDLFLGEMFGEIGSQKMAKDLGYFTPNDSEARARLPYAKDMSEARRSFVSYVRALTDYNRSIGLEKSLIVEATAAHSYCLEGGIGIPVLELMPGDPERLVPFTRGAAISYGRKMWGTYIAHEWYGGFRHYDQMKRKRLDLTYKYLYMQGSNLAVLESGDTEIASYGVSIPYSDPVCREYRDILRSFHEFADKNPRPSCGPYTKVAFIYGEDDGYTEFMGGAVFEQFGREEWAKGDEERSWKILSEIYRSPDWQDPLAYASTDGLDLNHAPAYGTYDVLSASAPLSVMSSYSYLIFVGHNTMSEALYNKLTDYVSGGGILLMSASHLSVNPERGGMPVYVNGGDLTALFGCRIVGSTSKCHGLKYILDSDIPGFSYPGTLNRCHDPIFTEGMTDYVTVELTSGKPKAELHSSFGLNGTPDVPVVIENKVGGGVAILTTHIKYPGNGAVYPVYRNLVKMLLAHSHDRAEVKVAGSDKVRFSLFFEEDGEKVLYLLNTAYDTQGSVKVLYNGKTYAITLDPMELYTLGLGL